MTSPSRYVILHHTRIDHPHYDLMLELTEDSDLSTWRLPNWPPAPADEFTPLPMHRRDYLTYEGPVSNNRGQVTRIASGTFHTIDDSQTTLKIALDIGLQISLPKKN